MICPECTQSGVVVKSKSGGYRRFECPLGHRWTIGAKKRGMKPGAVRLTGKHAKRYSAMFQI